MSKYYSCPKCGKVISGILDSNNMMFVGMGAYTKDKCQYCGNKIQLDAAGLLAGFGLYAVVIYFVIQLVEIAHTQAIESLKDAIHILIFVSMLPVGVLVFYVFLPFLLGVAGARLYR